MIEVSDSTICDVLINPYLNGSGSHYISDCPFCNKKNHLYVQRETSKTGETGNQSWMWECKHCARNGKLFRLLKELDRLDILEFARSIEFKKPLESIRTKVNVEQIQLELPTQKRPLGFQRISFHPYLDDRGFEDWQYKEYEIGITTKHPSLKAYIVFVVIEDGLCKGFVSRSLRSKQWLKEYNEKAKMNGWMKRLRYVNSTNTDFSKLLFGIDEINVRSVKTVILVEGVTDKANVDRLLKLHRQFKLKCLATFGKKISLEQIAKLQQRGITDVIVMFDPDALIDSKRDSYKLSKYFNVTAAFLKDKDPGDLTREELKNVLRNRETPLNFYLNKISSSLK